MSDFTGQWGWPTVSVAGVVGMLAGVLACTVESISYYPTTAKMCGMYYQEDTQDFQGVRVFARDLSP